MEKLDTRTVEIIEKIIKRLEKTGNDMNWMNTKAISADKNSHFKNRIKYLQ